MEKKFTILKRRVQNLTTDFNEEGFASFERHLNVVRIKEPDIDWFTFCVTQCISTPHEPYMGMVYQNLVARCAVTQQNLTSAFQKALRWGLEKKVENAIVVGQFREGVHVGNALDDAIYNSHISTDLKRRLIRAGFLRVFIEPVKPSLNQHSDVSIPDSDLFVKPQRRQSNKFKIANDMLDPSHPSVVTRTDSDIFVKPQRRKLNKVKSADKDAPGKIQSSDVTCTDSHKFVKPKRKKSDKVKSIEKDIPGPIISSDITCTDSDKFVKPKKKTSDKPAHKDILGKIQSSDITSTDSHKFVKPKRRKSDKVQPTEKGIPGPIKSSDIGTTDSDKFAKPKKRKLSQVKSTDKDTEYKENARP